MTSASRRTPSSMRRAETDETLDHRRRGDDPPEAKTREQNLRKGPDVDHDALAVERLQRCGRVAAVVETRIESVFDDRHLAPRRGGEQPAPRVGRDRQPAR